MDQEIPYKDQIGILQFYYQEMLENITHNFFKLGAEETTKMQVK